MKKLSMSRWSILFVLLLCIFAVGLRLYRLGELPSGLHNDEASFLVNAVSLLQTGKDEDGRAFPLVLKSYIDPKPAVYSYLQIPFVMLFGPTPFASRLPAVLCGIVSLFLCFLLIRKVSNQQVALLTTILLSISPWHIMVSRATQEVIFSFTFVLGSLLCVMPLVQEKKPRWFWYVGFFVCTTMAMYWYHSAKIFIPLLLAGVFMTALIKEKIRFSRLTVITALIVTAVVLSVALFGWKRFQAVSIFTTQEVQLVLNERITVATFGSPALINRVFDNKLVSYGYEVAKNYSAYFSIPFLFLSGGQPTRYMVPFHGLLYSIEVLFLIVGISVGFSQKQYRNVSIFFLAWLLLAPIPGALTWQEVPSTIRVFPMIVPLLFYVALGLFTLWHVFPQQKGLQKIVQVSIVCLYLLQFANFWFLFSVQQTYYHPWHRNFADMQLANEIKKQEKKYNHIYISNQEYTYFVLNHLIPLSLLQKSFPERTKPTAIWGKYTFINTFCFIEPKEHVLFVVPDNCDLKQNKYYYSLQIVGKVTFEDKVPAYKLIEYHAPYPVTPSVQNGTSSSTRQAERKA